MEIDSKSITKDAITEINNLITQEKWADAHRAAMEILRFDPDNLKVIRLLKKIEKKVRTENAKAIKKDLETLQPLWKEKKYEELLQNLKQLEPYLMDYPPLKKTIMRAQHEYEKQIREKQMDYYTTEKERIHKLLSDGKYQEALRDAQKLRLLKIHEKELKSFIKVIKKTWIEESLKNNEALLKTDKYEDILLFLQNLKRVDSKNGKVRKLMDEIKKKNELYKLDMKKDFIFEGLEKIRTLYQLKKYDKALDGARELLSIAPKNKTALSFFMKAKKRNEKKTERDLINQMKKTYKTLKESRKQGNKDIIKI